MVIFHSYVSLPEGIYHDLSYWNVAPEKTMVGRQPMGTPRQPTRSVSEPKPRPYVFDGEWETETELGLGQNQEN